MKKIKKIIIIVLIILNVFIISSKETLKITKIQTISNADENIIISRISDEQLTQGAICEYTVEFCKNINIDKSNIKAVVLNSVNTVVANAYVLINEGVCKICVDTSTLPAGLYRVMFLKDSITYEDGSISTGKMSDEGFSVILVEDKG